MPESGSLIPRNGIADGNCGSIDTTYTSSLAVTGVVAPFRARLRRYSPI